MNFYVLAIAGLLAFFVLKGTGSLGQSGQGSMGTTDTNPQVTRANPWNLPDIDSANQAGGYGTSFDESFEKASGETQVPFALIKAHAIRESSLKPGAYHYDNPKSGASYGLMQVEWLYGSDRFSDWGVPDSNIGMAGDLLYDPDTNARLGALVIADNLKRFNGNLRDAINAYNTGAAESVRVAPGNYVNDVLAHYSKITGETVS